MLKRHYNKPTQVSAGRVPFMKARSQSLFTLCFLAVQSCSMFSAQAQGTAFTYQGRLMDGTIPATGSYDLRFTLYDSTNNTGTVIAGPVTNPATSVTNGMFTVLLDFGPLAFSGAPRWLEI